MILVNAMGDACPVPVVKTRNAIRDLNGPGMVQTLVDNEIAVQNLAKMAAQKNYGVQWEQQAPSRFLVTLTVGDGAQIPAADEPVACEAVSTVAARRRVVVAVGAATMGIGGDELGRALLKGFLYALSQQEAVPDAVLFYNGGAALTCEASPSLEDIRMLEARGAEILTCGTCLNFYGLTEMLRAGTVTNMYTIAERMTQADLLVKP